MTQIRYWNTGDPVTAEKTRSVQIGLHKKGVYRRYNVTVYAPDTVTIGAGGFALLPDGIAVSETEGVRLRLSVLPTVPTEYTITARHIENNLSGGVAVVYAYEVGHLVDADISNGIVIAWLSYPGSGVAFTDSMITLPPLVGDGILPGGAASGDLGGNYPNPDVVGIRTVPVDASAAAAVPGDILVVDTDGTYHAKSAASILGSGIPSANFNVLGPSTDYTPPTNFVDGFREFGVAGQIAQIVVSQEVAGTSGSTDLDLYKIDVLGTETMISVPGSLSVSFAAGNKARIVSSSFLPGTNTFTATDRIGVKVAGLQLNGEDVSINVIVAGASLPAPTVTTPNTHATQSQAITVPGVTPAFAGCIYLPAGMLLMSQTRIAVGTTTAGDTARFQLRRMSDSAIVYDVTVAGFVVSVTPAANIIIPTEGFYELWLWSPSGGVASLAGTHFVWAPTTSLDIDYASNVITYGVVPTEIGSVYLTPGTLQGTTSVVLSSTGPGAPVTILELRRPDTFAVIATFMTSGTPGREVVTIAGPVYVPVAGFYTMTMYGGTVTTASGFHGMKANVSV